MRLSLRFAENKASRRKANLAVVWRLGCYFQHVLSSESGVFVGGTRETFLWP